MPASSGADGHAARGPWDYGTVSSGARRPFPTRPLPDADVGAGWASPVPWRDGGPPTPPPLRSAAGSAKTKHATPSLGSFLPCRPGCLPRLPEGRRRSLEPPAANSARRGDPSLWAHRPVLNEGPVRASRPAPRPVSGTALQRIAQRRGKGGGAYILKRLARVSVFTWPHNPRSAVVSVPTLLVPAEPAHWRGSPTVARHAPPFRWYLENAW